MSGAQLAEAARALVGAPFRLHGRDPASGLDCVGVLAASLVSCGRPVHVPQGYALRNRTLPRLDAFVSACGLVPAEGPALPGDVLLVRAGPGQFHLLISTGAQRCIHAHASLRRVVEADLPPHWPLVEHWRLTATD
jgi:cell wall-associated NlpC family hydrolase